MTFEVLVKWRGPYLTVPMKRTGSWGMTDSLLLKSSRPMRAMSTPSMMIDPRLSSASLKSATPSEDFPEETTHLCHNLFPPPAVQTNTNNIRQTDRRTWTRSANYPYGLLWKHTKGQILQDQRKVIPVSHFHILEGDPSFFWPAGSRSGGAADLPRTFAFQVLSE